ncbi:MAG: outer membrane beta-barrel protein, partial [Bacteroidota bacterium]
YKQVNGLITSYQFTEFVEEVGREVVVSSYANANSSYAYGAEFTLRNTFFDRKLEITSNVNLYNSRVDGSNIEEGLVADQFTWFIKENVNITLPWDLRLQLTGEYQSPAAFSPSSGRFNWRGVTNTAQGYRISYWYADAALSKRMFNRKANLTVAISDIFATRIQGQVSESDFFYQESEGIGKPQIVRVNFSWNFGKPDMSLFKRKNMNFNTNGMDMQ